MLDVGLGLEIIALSFLFLLSGIWSKETVRFGYVLVPLMAGFFWWAGFLPFAYLPSVIPLLVFMGVISFLRQHLKYDWGFFGTGGGILYKLVFFLIMMQLAIGYINGMGLFTTNMAATPSNSYTTDYNLTNAEARFEGSTTGLDIVDAVANGLHFVWMMFGVLWSMIASVFCIYPTLVNTFGVPADLSILLQAGIYIIYVLELVNMVYKPSKPVEV